jgi:hypothetical protein
MSRYTLNLNDLAVDSFATASADSGIMIPPPSLTDPACCEEMYIMAPITAHTDPCDVCCQQQ